MAGIFISYRRDDSAAQARAVWERLCREFGRDQVFMDVDGIDPGDDFTEVIDRQLEGCQVMLVMIGARWHSVTDAHGRLRLHHRHDFVRYEVETALRRRIKLVPVLIDSTPTPLEEHLPVELHPLLRRQGLELDFRRHTEAALQRLVEVSRKALVLPSAPSRPAWMHDEGTDQYGRWCEFKVGDVVQRMRLIEAGTFWMGLLPEDSDQSNHELRRRVVLNNGFWLADTVCTQALWNEVMDFNPSIFRDNSQLPVECVSWNAVTSVFLPKINQIIAGLNLELPTEAQWEYACRSGTTTPFSFGDQISTKQVNYDGNRPYKGGIAGVWRRKTLPVKAMPANHWGLYQMHGNVWEWCVDEYAPYAGSVVEDPVVLQGIGRRNQIIRGGCWCDRAEATLSGFRSAYEPQDRNNTIGFRLARVLGD